ncbi:MAG: L,D-transpeptidase [Flavobacteriales bacterium]|nr:L,D-transpeptidase [Flavobacteriales bacterium]
MTHWGLHILLLPFVLSTPSTHTPAGPPSQDLVDMLLEYMEVRYPGHDMEGDLLYVQVSSQRLFHVRGRRLVREYTIATASNGLGSETNSYRTPTGLHRVSRKYGDGVPMYGILKDRKFTGELADPDFAGVDQDWITSRILWLDGLEPGHNQGGKIDSRRRYIYIHGTANERSIGTPSSRGCIRMRNADVIELYDQVPVGALVVVLDN